MKKIGTGHKAKHKAKYKRAKQKTKSSNKQSNRSNRQSKQSSFFKINSQHRFSYGGVLRNKRAGRGMRPLSTKEPLHLVFKVNSEKLRQKSLRSPQGFTLANTIIKKYAECFVVKIEQLSIQNNHIHALIRTSRRSQYQHFFRVVAGQIAQRFAKEGLLRAQAPALVQKQAQKQEQVTDALNARIKQGGLWQYRPFTRVVRGWKAYQIVRNYVQLNEKEIRGEIRYQKNRLRGLSSADWEILWS